MCMYSGIEIVRGSVHLYNVHIVIILGVLQLLSKNDLTSE